MTKEELILKIKQVKIILGGEWISLYDLVKLVIEDTPKDKKIEKIEILPDNEHYSNKVLYGKINKIIDRLNGE